MRRAICLILALAFCLSLSCTVFASGDDFVASPGESGTPEVTEPATEGGSNMPQTGDNSAMGLWIGLMLAAVAALVAVVVVYRKKFAKK